MVEAARVYARYEMPNEKNQTRRQRNENADEYTPEFIIPTNGMYIWHWYTSISKCFSRIIEGQCRPIPPSELQSWFTITGNLIYRFEYDILLSMDSIYCDEINKEIRGMQAKREEKYQNDIEKAKSKSR